MQLNCINPPETDPQMLFCSYCKKTLIFFINSPRGFSFSFYFSFEHVSILVATQKVVFILTENQNNLPIFKFLRSMSLQVDANLVTPHKHVLYILKDKLPHVFIFDRLSLNLVFDIMTIYRLYTTSSSPPSQWYMSSRKS